MGKRRKKSDPPLYKFPLDDNWKPRGNRAKADNRPYVTTNEGTMPGLPQGDKYDPGVAWWGNKRIWLGNKPKARYKRPVTPGGQTRLRKLFDLLAVSPGHWHPVSEIHARVFGGRVSKRQRKAATQNVRRLVSRLKGRLAEYRVDEDAIIVPVRVNGRRGYVTLLLQDQKYQDGEQPWPKLEHIEHLEAREGMRRERQEREDEFPSGVVFWGESKSIRLGEQTKTRHLFELLAHPPGQWRPVSKIEEFVFGTCCDTSLGVPEEDMRKAQQKIRRLVSRLKERMRQAGLNSIIVPHRYAACPGYFLLVLPEQNRDATIAKAE